MYFIDFFKGLFNKSHVGTIIWMIVNLAVICTAFAFIAHGMSESIVGGIFFGLFAYALSLVLALSPVGEYITRFQNGCKKAEKYPDAEARLRPLFDEVYAKAKAKNPSLSDSVKLYIREDDTPNAFATGRSTVCVTTGLLDLDDRKIKGILGHEFGHLAHKDTYILQAISVGNLFVSVLFFLTKFVIDAAITTTRIVLHFAIDTLLGRIIMGILGKISKLIIDGMLALLMYLWTRLGIAICMASSRSDEYEADRYSCDLGYGSSLAQALSALSGVSYKRKKDLWAALSASHPDTQDRIGRINSYMAGSVTKDNAKDPVVRTPAADYGKTAVQTPDAAYGRPAVQAQPVPFKRPAGVSAAVVRSADRYAKYVFD